MSTTQLKPNIQIRTGASYGGSRNERYRTTVAATKNIFENLLKDNNATSHSANTRTPLLRQEKFSARLASSNNDRRNHQNRDSQKADKACAVAHLKDSQRLEDNAVAYSEETTLDTSNTAGPSCVINTSSIKPNTNTAVNVRHGGAAGKRWLYTKSRSATSESTPGYRHSNDKITLVNVGVRNVDVPSESWRLQETFWADYRLKRTFETSPKKLVDDDLQREYMSLVSEDHVLVHENKSEQDNVDKQIIYQQRPTGETGKLSVTNADGETTVPCYRSTRVHLNPCIGVEESYTEDELMPSKALTSSNLSKTRTTKHCSDEWKHNIFGNHEVLPGENNATDLLF